MAGHRFIANGPVFIEFKLLTEIANGGFKRKFYGTAVGPTLSSNDLQQGRFARSISADEADAVFGTDHKADFVEQCPLSVFY